jgi:hypothetical protein
MKDAILGTTHHSTTESAETILRTAVQTHFQCIAGYIPPRLPDNVPLLPPVHTCFAEPLRPMLRTLCKHRGLREGNARMPYLTMAWMLIGQDYPYQAVQFVSDKRLVISLAGMLVGIALGDYPDKERTSRIYEGACRMYDTADKGFFRLLRQIDSYGQERERIEGGIQAAIMVLHAAKIIHLKRQFSNKPIPKGLRQSMRRMVSLAYSLGDRDGEVLHSHARKWRVMDDKQAWQLANRLMLDLLELHENTR